MCLVVDMAILGCSESWFPSILASPLSGVRIFGLRCLGVRNFGFTVFWLAGYLGVQIPGFTVPLDLRILQHTWISGSLCGCLLQVVWFLKEKTEPYRLHDTLVAASAPFMMPLRDSDIPMNVPFTISNKQPLTPSGSFLLESISSQLLLSLGESCGDTHVPAHLAAHAVGLPADCPPPLSLRSCLQTSPSDGPLRRNDTSRGHSAAARLRRAAPYLPRTPLMGYRVLAPARWGLRASVRRQSAAGALSPPWIQTTDSERSLL
jgi:hypothetical protein